MCHLVTGPSSIDGSYGLLQLGATWLMEWYRKTSGEADETVATAIALSLLSKRSADEIASELLDLLGSEAMDQLGDLLSHRCFSSAVFALLIGLSSIAALILLS